MSQRRSVLVVLAVVACVACSEERSIEWPPDASAALPDHMAGKPCENDSDCATGRCANKLNVQETRAKRGYCTTDCENDARCGVGGECSVLAGEDEGECLATCASNDECRDGYICAGVGRLPQISIRGTCQPKPETGQLEEGAVGQACISSANCRGGECASMSTLGTKFPGNYCTARCLEDSECGSTGACLLFESSTNAGQCYYPCSSDDDCTREGYRCRSLGPGFSACYPAPAALPDRTAGKACARDADCGGARDSCADELPFGSWSANEIVPAPGGYCTQPCSLDAECGEGAQCISRGAMGGMCLGRCQTQTGCREGYVCMAHGRDLNESDQVCIPAPTPPGT
jgi:hypothetical protein